jgi:hypothetical protein
MMRLIVVSGMVVSLVGCHSTGSKRQVMVRVPILEIRSVQKG